LNKEKLYDNDDPFPITKYKISINPHTHFPNLP